MAGPGVVNIIMEGRLSRHPTWWGGRGTSMSPPARDAEGGSDLQPVRIGLGEEAEAIHGNQVLKVGKGAPA